MPANSNKMRDEQKVKQKIFYNTRLVKSNKNSTYAECFPSDYPNAKCQTNCQKRFTSILQCGDAASGYQRLNNLNPLLLFKVASLVESESLPTASSEPLPEVICIRSACSMIQSVKSGEDTNSDIACLVQYAFESSHSCSVYFFRLGAL